MKKHHTEKAKRFRQFLCAAKFVNQHYFCLVLCRMSTRVLQQPGTRLSSPSSRNMACQLLLGFKVDNVSVYTSALLISLHTPDYEAEVTENNLTINSTVLGFSTVHSEVFLWSSCCSFWRNGKKNSSIGWMNYFLTRAHSWAISEHLKTHTVSKWRVQKRRHQTVYVYCTIMVTQRTIECTLSTRELKMGAKRFGEETTISVHPERGG